MRFTPVQWLLVGLAILIPVALFFLVRTTPKVKKGATAPEEQEAVNINILMNEAREALDTSELRFLTELESRLAAAEDIPAEIQLYKLISRTWNESKRYVIGGYYAEKVAELEATGEAWSIAGTTYGMGFQTSTDMPTKRFAATQAISAFQEAQKLEPDTLVHKINEALMEVELASADPTVMPMQAILKLRDLADKNPDNARAQMSMGRLSMRSGQFEKAVPRFEQVVALNETQELDQRLVLEAHYALADCYKMLENKEKIAYHYDMCIKLSENDVALQERFRQEKAAFFAEKADAPQ